VTLLQTKMMTLNSTNYHSIEANGEYMSVSQFKDFDACEAMAMAKLSGWSEPDKEALLLGSYVHAGIEGDGALEEFKLRNPDIISSKGPTKGELLAKFKHADVMLEKLHNDPFSMFVLDGQKEVIMTAELYGVPFKIRIDSYAPDRGRLADLKTTKGIREKYWSNRYGGWVSFVEAYDYLLQMAVYCEVERIATGRDGWLEPLMVAVSKEDVPDLAVIRFDEHRLRIELEIMEHKLPRIMEVKTGIAQPIRCEKCRYCRETKRLTGTIHFADLLDG